MVLALDDAARREHRRSGRESAKRDERGEQHESARQCATELPNDAAELARDCRYARPLLEHPLRQVVCAEVKCDDADGRRVAVLAAQPTQPGRKRATLRLSLVATQNLAGRPTPVALVPLSFDGPVSCADMHSMGCVGAMLPVVHSSHRAHPACIHVVLCCEQRVQMESVGAKLAATVGDAVAER